MLKCNNCGNTGEFVSVVKTQDVWICDNQGNRTEFLYETRDHNYACEKCRSYDVKKEKK
jgi:predicted nucleic acid-binding Zn ribbon protein